MKKILVLILVATVLVACSPTDTGTPSESKVSGDVTSDVASDVAEEKDTDINGTITRYTTEGKVTKLVGDPNAKGELFISQVGGGKIGNKVKTAVEKFEELYPNVELTFEEVPIIEPGDHHNYTEKLKTEVMAGKGPDIFQLSAEMDRNKMQQSGKFADLAPFFEADMNFNIKDYNETIFYNSQYNGKQYIVPDGYQVPTFLTTKSIADEKLVDTQKFNGYISTIDEVIRIIKNEVENPERPAPIGDVNRLSMYLADSGLKYIDYEKNSLILDENDIKPILTKQKELAEAIKLLKPQKFGIMTSYASAESLQNNQSLLVYYPTNFYGLLNNSRYLSTKDEPILLPFCNIRGNITATISDPYMVNNASKNLQNAYNFMKILISPEVQGHIDEGEFLPHNYIPISNEARDKVIELMKNPSTTDPNLPGLSQEFIDNYMNIIGKIDSVFYDYNMLIYNEMRPYLDGKADLETCLQSTIDKLEIYISE